MAEKNFIDDEEFEKLPDKIKVFILPKRGNLKDRNELQKIH